MVEKNIRTTVVYDGKPNFRQKSGCESSSSQQRGTMFPVSNDAPQESYNQSELKSDQMNIRSLLKEVEYFGSSCMSWKERKKLEDKKVVALGGKPSKKQRLPLSVARGAMKKQKLQEQKKLEEDLILGRYMKSSKRKQKERRKPEDRVLMATEGRFSGGVLNVKHLLKKKQPKITDTDANESHKSSWKGQGKKNAKKRMH